MTALERMLADAANAKDGRSVAVPKKAAMALLQLWQATITWERAKVDAAIVRRRLAETGLDSMRRSAWIHNEEEIRARDLHLAALAALEALP